MKNINEKYYKKYYEKYYKNINILWKIFQQAFF